MTHKAAHRHAFTKLYLCSSCIPNFVLLFTVKTNSLKIYSILFENKLKTIDVIPGKGEQSSVGVTNGFFFKIKCLNASHRSRRELIMIGEFSRHLNISGYTLLSHPERSFHYFLKFQSLLHSRINEKINQPFHGCQTAL